jgi:FkbM family methyltransferase
MPSLRDHLYRIRHHILAEPLNKGRRLHYLLNYLRWHGWAKWRSTPWTITFENGMRSLVKPHPDHDAGEKNIWTRNVDWYDTELIRRVLKPGDTVVDAGCNVGNRTWALADLLGGALMLDAGATAIARTREHRALNGLPEDRYHIVHKAVGATPGTITFTDLGGASTMNRVLEPGQTAPPGVRTVQLERTTIDNELARLGMRPAYMKIDVEGQDLPALQGAIETLRSGCVRLVKFEHNAPEPLQPVLDFWKELVWEVFALDRDRITQDRARLERDMNLFAAPKEVFGALQG